MCYGTVTGMLKHLSAMQAGKDAPPDITELPPLDSEAAEVKWVADAISLWLDEEWLPQDVHRELGKAAGQVRPRLIVGRRVLQ